MDKNEVKAIVNRAFGIVMGISKKTERKIRERKAELERRENGILIEIIDKKRAAAIKSMSKCVISPEIWYASTMTDSGLARISVKCRSGTVQNNSFDFSFYINEDEFKKAIDAYPDIGIKDSILKAASIDIMNLNKCYLVSEVARKIYVDVGLGVITDYTQAHDRAMKEAVGYMSMSRCNPGKNSIVANTFIETSKSELNALSQFDTRYEFFADFDMTVKLKVKD